MLPRVDEQHRALAAVARQAIEQGRPEPAAFRALLFSVPKADRDAWLDLVFGLEGSYDDGPELPRGGVPYLPCPVDLLLAMVEEAAVTAADIFVDIGSGVGRAVTLVHLLTGAAAIGVEIQPRLVAVARELSARLGLAGVSMVEGDAAALTPSLGTGSVFFFYCPFSGRRLARVLEDLEGLSRTKPLRLACVNLPLPPSPWLTRGPGSREELVVYRSGPRSGTTDPSLSRRAADSR